MNIKKVDNRKLSGLMRYPGGKAKLLNVINGRLQRIFAKLRPEAEFREPFFGAGAVGMSLLAQNPGIRRAWLNDADPGIAALWHTVINNPTSLHVMVEVTPEAMRLFPKSDYYRTDVELLRSLTGPENLQQIPTENLAIAKLVAHQMSFSGLGSRAGGPMSNRLSRYNVDTLCSKIYSSNEILSSVKLRHGTCTCFDFGQMFDGGEAFFYLDPPYYAAGPKLYQFAFTHDDHERLAKRLRGENRPWLLSYDDHPVIHRLYGGWCRLERVEVACSINGSNRKKELLITTES
jgi:DNA adenine methylase